MKYFLVCLLSGVLSATCLPSQAFADQQDFTESLKACKAITSLVPRTKCYDTAIDDYDLNTFKKRNNTDTNGWRLDTKKSPLTGNLNVTLSLASNDLFTTRGNTQVRRFLILACNEGQPSAYITWGTEIGRLEGTVNTNSDNIVNSRFGADPIVAERWLISTDKTASFIPKPVEFYTKLLNAKGLYAVTIWPTAYYDAISATFDVQGLADQTKPLKESCHLP